MQHIDAGIDLLRLRQSKHPEWFRSERLCFIDTMLGRLWLSHYADFVKSGANGADAMSRTMPPGLWDFYMGELPSFCKSRKSWVLEIDIIYTALHVGGNHWIALMISLPDRHVTVWDSILGPKTEETVQEALKPICEIFPYALHVMATADDRWHCPLEPFTYTIVKSPDLPQNKVTGDCGVYCLKFLEFHSLGMEFPKYLCDKNIKQIRDRLAFGILSELRRTGEEPRNDYTVLDVYNE